MAAGGRYQLRSYEPRDAGRLATILFRSVREVARAHYSAEQVEAWAPDEVPAEDIHAYATDGRSVLVAVDEHDRPVAFADVEADGHIDRMFCSPEAAGRGVASMLCEGLEDHARSAGIDRLHVEASEGARPVFERHAFTLVERQEVVVRGTALHNYRMEKHLR